MTEVVAPLVYEVPLNERTRLFLRLEFLFAQATFHRKEASHWNRRQYLLALLDILQLLSRSDVRTEVSKELADHIAKLERLMHHPEVDAQRLGNVLDALRGLDQALMPVQAQFASNLLRDSEFLNGLLNRSTIPGGTAPFDMPALHLWLQRTAEQQDTQLQTWTRHVDLFEQCIAFTLRLTRQTGELRDLTAPGGNFSTPLNQPYQMLRVFVPAGQSLYPEISAGRHRCSIRFLQLQEPDLKPVQSTQDVSFQVAFCGL